MDRIPVNVYKVNPKQFGDGIYSMIACFINLRVHVPFTFFAHSENEYVESVGDPVPCDGTCRHRGHMEDFAIARHRTDYSVERIITAANDFGHIIDITPESTQSHGELASL
jgi:hypothetical protein